MSARWFVRVDIVVSQLCVSRADMTYEGAVRDFQRPGLKIVSPLIGRWRPRRAWSAAPVMALSEKQIEDLNAGRGVGLSLRLSPTAILDLPMFSNLQRPCGFRMIWRKCEGVVRGEKKRDRSSRVGSLPEEGFQAVIKKRSRRSVAWLTRWRARPLMQSPQRQTRRSPRDHGIGISRHIQHWMLKLYRLHRSHARLCNVRIFKQAST
jgi:hypothetical protein